jgi:hypothetical protein
MMGSKRRPRQAADAPHVIQSKAELQARVDAHKTTYGCPGTASLYNESCPCGAKVLIMCSACRTAVLMMVSKRPCRHEMVYHLDDGTTMRPFEGY